jgi:hypothetical protein
MSLMGGIVSRATLEQSIPCSFSEAQAPVAAEMNQQCGPFQSAAIASRFARLWHLDKQGLKMQ